MKPNQRIAVVSGCSECGKAVSIRTTAESRERDKRRAICRECHDAKTRYYQPKLQTRATAPDP